MFIFLIETLNVSIQIIVEECESVKKICLKLSADRF